MTGLTSIADADNFSLLFDFGSPDSPTGGGTGGPAQHWNNVTAAVGTVAGSTIPGLVDVAGQNTPVGLEILSRFNNANENGAIADVPYPATATRDSLFGNTERSGSLENIKPAFKLYGLTPGIACSLTFYASRMGGSDHRETRYVVNGESTDFVDLDALNNVTNTVRLNGVRTDANGEFQVELTPGPNNDNANHFTYLGVLQLDTDAGLHLLLDFGANESPTETQEAGTPTAWNNVTTTIGADGAGKIQGVVTMNGAVTAVNLHMVSRFNAANQNGSTNTSLFPQTASEDSLFGNTELFRGVANVTPVFKLTGLNPDVEYSLEFFASRMGVEDNRETRYTVQGASMEMVDLNAANNSSSVATINGIQTDSAGELAISLTPGPNNNNANHFTYLGVLRVSWNAPAPTTTARLDQPVYDGKSFRFRLSGKTGVTYRVLGSVDLKSWFEAQSVTLTAPSIIVEIPSLWSLGFVRADAAP